MSKGRGGVLSPSRRALTLSPCSHPLAVLSPCSRRALAVLSPCSHPLAVLSPCSRRALTVLSPSRELVPRVAAGSRQLTTFDE